MNPELPYLGTSGNREKRPTGVLTFCAPFGHERRMVPNFVSAWRKHRNLSQDEAAEAIGTTKSMYGKLERGERTLDTDWLDKMGRAFRCEPYQIIAAAPGHEPNDRTSASLEDVAAEHNLAFVEEIDLALGMGATYLDGSQPEVLGLVPFKQDWLHGLYDGPLDKLKVVRGRGDSMEPTIREGDTILIDTSQRRLDDQDRIWAVAYGELGMIRRIKATPRGTWLLIPDNKVVNPDEATDGEATLLGRVIWIGRRI
ncbi:helix-turn-helix transcriptional regulator [Sphingobium sp. LMC3-1-1.1]